MKTKIFKRVISVLCAVTMTNSCLASGVSAVGGGNGNAGDSKKQQEKIDEKNKLEKLNNRMKREVDQLEKIFNIFGKAMEEQEKLEREKDIKEVKERLIAMHIDTYYDTDNRDTDTYTKYMNEVKKIKEIKEIKEKLIAIQKKIGPYLNNYKMYRDSDIYHEFIMLNSSAQVKRDLIDIQFLSFTDEYREAPQKIQHKFEDLEAKAKKAMEKLEREKAEKNKTS